MRVSSPDSRDEDDLPSLPSRSQLRSAESRVLKEAGPTKAHLTVVDLGQGPMAVKDFAGRAWWVRQIGRLQIGRECRAYRRLGRMPGLPRLIGRIDRYALAVELIPGTQIGLTTERFDRGPRLFPKLARIVSDLHDRGLVHLDLRSSDNVLVTDDDRVYVLDLASAVWMRPGGLAHRWLFPRLRLVDESALLKWKRLLNAGDYSEAEREFLDRYGFWRGLWPFNQKKRRKGGASGA